jgi:phage tail-like protein
VALLGTFNFRVKLIKSPQIQAGRSGVSGPVNAQRPTAPDGGPQDDQELGDGGFQECSGLEVEMDVQELVEGGRNDGVIQRVGRGKYPKLTLKRGMFFADGNGALNAELWRWLQGVLSGERPVRRYDGVIEVFDNAGARESGDGRVVATWSFVRGLPAKIAGPHLNARTGDIALEELTIAHEGLRLETTP